MTLPKCNLTSCTLRERCQRFHPEGNYSPILPFMPEGVIPEPNQPYTGPLNGCEDFWPIGTVVEYFETNEKKTPVPPARSTDPDVLQNQLSLFS